MFKKSKLALNFLIILIGLLGFFAIPISLQSQETSSETIKSYTVDIAINTDSSIQVIEKIVYDFGDQGRHGINRDIPFKYKARGGTYAHRISGMEVTDGQGNPVEFSQSQNSGTLSLKIGDPDKTVTGANSYRISYTVRRAVNYFSTHDELYWNAIGTHWGVPIEKSTITVAVPMGATNSQCYIGAVGATETLCTIVDNKTDKIVFSYDKPLQPAEGFTVVIGLPSGTLTKPSLQEKITDTVVDNGVLGLPILVLVAMLWIWWRYGRDAYIKKTVVPQYDPPQGLPPLYAGALIDGKVDNKDLSAEIISLASQGFLKIERIETTRLLWFKGSDYKFIKQAKASIDLLPQSKAIYQALFAGGDTVQLSQFKSEEGFGKSLIEIRGKVFSELTKLGYYRSNPRTMQTLFTVGGVIIAAGGSALLGHWFGTFGTVAAVTSGIIIVAFGFIMPARTAKGAEMRSYILGLKKYISVAEQDRLEFHNAPEKNPARFELLLPFAIALGVERLWANQFKDIYNQQPGWYNDSTSNSFSAMHFSSSLQDFSGSVQAAASSATSTASSASSGGSGFSGGGVGGGGGGGGGSSW